MNLPTVISRFFEPMVVFTALTVVGALRANLSPADLQLFLLLLFFGMVVPTTVFRLWMVGSGQVKDWDIHDRRQRRLPLLVLLVFILVQTFFVTGLGNQTLIDLFIIYSAWMVGFFLITLLWKISGHVGAITLATGLIVGWYGWAWWPLLLLVPLVAWARVVRHDHTLTQVIGGALYSGSILWLARIFNF